MTLEAWLAAAAADASARGLDAVVPMLETLATATRALRNADWNVPADVSAPPPLPPAAGHAVGITPAGDAAEPASTSAWVEAPSTLDGTTPPELRSVTAVLPLLSGGALSARDLVDACLARIDQRNPLLNAMITVMAADARREAERLDAERAAGHPCGPLHGVPITLKDLVDVAGVPTTAASQVRRGLRASGDATVTRRLREAGAIVLGKTNLHEFAFGTTSEDSAFGPVRHPDDAERPAGGSSGGSAAAVRAGMGLASIGTDTGGSVRIPAAWCGLVGLKPDFDDVPTDGVVPLAPSLDHVGPLTRSVDDAWLLFDVLSGRAAGTAPRAGSSRPERLRLALLEPYFCDLLEDGVRRAFFAAVDELSAAGIDIVRAALPHASLIAPVYLHTVLAEAMAYHAPTLDRRPEDYTAPVRTRLELGRYVLGEDYVRAVRGRAILSSEVDDLLGRCDALVLPTMPMTPPALGAGSVLLGQTRQPLRNATLRLTQLFDLTGHPAITLPIGDASPGLPAGLQLAGHRRRTPHLLATARTCEGVLRRGA